MAVRYFFECPQCYSELHGWDEQGNGICEKCGVSFFLPRIERRIIAGKRFVAAVGERVWK